MLKDKYVLVIGAGIGGLAATLAIQRAGCRVTVYEIGESLREFGAGVVITPNAMHALNSLGVGKQLAARSEEHTSELQSLMRISYDVFCLQKKNITMT